METKDKRKAIDTLFVINQDIDLFKIFKLHKKNKIKNCLILTTHYLFKNEKSEIKNILADKATIKTFSDFLSDSEMEECDYKANAFIEQAKIKLYGGEYTKKYIELSLAYKNELVAQKIEEHYNIKNIYFNTNLGINNKTWEKRNGKNLNYKNIFLKIPKKVFVLVCSTLKEIFSFFKKTEITIIKDIDYVYVFFTSTKRINFNKITIIKDIFKNINFLNLNIKKNSKTQIVQRYIKFLSDKFSLPAKICTTIHEYNHLFLKNFDEENIYIFVDGYLPSNYTKYNLDSYIGTFVSKNMFDHVWFKKFNKKTIKKNSLVEIPMMSTNIVIPKINNIILTPGHAGDWSALINRSDQDILIESFINLSKKIKNINFVITVHPSMISQNHQGLNSLKRIEKYINSLNLNNLTISDIPVDKIIEKGDIFISEYSQVLLDLFKMGKIGIITNLTNRRSFMKDYEDLGYLHVKNEQELFDMISGIIRNPKDYTERQRIASIKYNQLISDYVK